MSDILEEAATFFRLLTQNEYTLILGKKGNEQKIILRCKDEHFPHLIGLDKLHDQKTKIYRDGKQAVLSNIEKDILKLEDLKKSNAFSIPLVENQQLKLEDRIAYFKEFKPVFEALTEVKDEIYCTFLKRNAYSSIDADFLIRLRIPTPDMNYMYLNLFIKKDTYDNETGIFYIPVSFFPRLNNDYETNQTKWTLLYKDRVCRICQKKYNLYQLASYQEKTKVLPSEKNRNNIKMF